MVCKEQYGCEPKKFQLVFLGLNSHQGQRLYIESSKVSATDCVNLLGVEIDNKLKFDKHVKTLCSKVNKKINAFSILNTYFSRDHTLLICNTLIPLNFNYYPLVWMFCNQGGNKEIDRTHNRVLRILYEDDECSFEILLTRRGSVCIHVKNLQKLMIEVYKSVNHLNQSLVWEFHEKKHVEYNLRTKNLCRLPKIRSTSF